MKFRGKRRKKFLRSGKDAYLCGILYFLHDTILDGAKTV